MKLLLCEESACSMPLHGCILDGKRKHCDFCNIERMCQLRTRAAFVEKSISACLRCA